MLLVTKFSIYSTFYFSFLYSAFLLKKVRPQILNPTDFRFQVQIVWQDGYYLTANGNELVLEV